MVAVIATFKKSHEVSFACIGVCGASYYHIANITAPADYTRLLHSTNTVHMVNNCSCCFIRFEFRYHLADWHHLLPLQRIMRVFYLRIANFIIRVQQIACLSMHINHVLYGVFEAAPSYCKILEPIEYCGS